MVPVMRHLMLVMALLLASIETVKLEDSEDDIEDVRKGREIMEKVKANNLSFQFDLVINRYSSYEQDKKNFKKKIQHKTVVFLGHMNDNSNFTFPVSYTHLTLPTILRV